MCSSLEICWLLKCAAWWSACILSGIESHVIQPSKAGRWQEGEESVHSNTGKARPWESKKERDLPRIHTVTEMNSPSWFSCFRGSKRAGNDTASVFKNTELPLHAREELLSQSGKSARGHKGSSKQEAVLCRSNRAAWIHYSSQYSGALSMDSRGIYSCPWLLGNLIVQVCTRGSQ